jgi:hypothetical protein
MREEEESKKHTKPIKSCVLFILVALLNHLEEI